MSDEPHREVKPSAYMVEAVAFAEAEADARVRETEGKNNSARIREYQSVCGCAPPDPYCGCFVAWCIKQACKKLNIAPPFDLVLCAYTPTLYRHCKKINSWRDTIQRGDLAFVHNSRLGRIAHVMFVAGPIESGGMFRAVEGNTNYGGSRDGDGVYRSKRVNNDNIIFARL